MVMTVPPVRISPICRGAAPSATTSASHPAIAAANNRGMRKILLGETRCIVPSVPVHLIEHPLAQDALATLRDARTDPGAFRQTARRISVLLAMEALRDLPTIGDDSGHTTRDGAGAPRRRRCRRRAGAPRGTGHAGRRAGARARREGRAISDYSATSERRSRRSTTRSCRRDLRDSYVLMVDPMLATGGSAVAGLDLLLAAGATNIRVVCIVVGAGRHRCPARRASGDRNLHSSRRSRTERAQVHPAGPWRFRRPALRDDLTMGTQHERQTHPRQHGGPERRAGRPRSLASSRTRSSCAAICSTS